MRTKDSNLIARDNAYPFSPVLCYCHCCRTYTTTLPLFPECVSSQADDNHFIDPLAIKGDTEKAFSRLRQILEQRADTTIIETGDKLIRVEFKTTLGFVDDGLFIFDEDKKAVQIRSASRSGYWDFGKNRRRLEEIRRQFQ